MIAMSTLYETIAAYDGLAVQAYFRGLIFGVPLVLFLGNILLIFVRGRSLKDPDEAAWNLMKYAFFTGLLLAAFYPEAALVGRPLTTTLAASEVMSINAQVNGEPIQTAQQYKTNLGQDIVAPLVPPTFLQLVELVSGTTMSLGQYISANANRPSSRAFPISWLVSHKLSANAEQELRHWARHCVKPARVTLLNKNPNVTYQQSLEIPGTQLWTEMGFHRAHNRLGARNVYDQRRRCNVRGDALRTLVRAGLNAEPTPKGEPLSLVIQRDLGMPIEEAVSLLITSKVRLLFGSQIPVPEKGVEVGLLGALKATVDGLANLLSNIDVTKPAKFLGGFTKAAGDEINTAIGKVQQQAAAALYFANWAPYLYAKVIFIVVSFFPIVLCFVVAMPQRQLAPLAIYLGWLFVAFSSPVVFGTIEYFAETFTHVRASVMASPAGWAHNHIGVLAIQSSGYIVAAIISAIVTLAGTIGIAYFVRV